MTDVPLSELVTLLKRGVSPKYADEGHVVINQKCIRDFTLDYSPSRRINISTRVAEEKWVQQWDVLVNSTGVGTLGRVTQVTEAPSQPTTVDSHVTIARPNPKRVHPPYFGFAIKAFQTQIESMGAGATGQTELSRERLGAEIVVPIPNRSKQECIAAILSAYEDLIKNNTLRIAILEEMARLLYEEWFVHYRFPGHEEAEFEDGEGGMSPADWPIVPLEDVVQVNPRTAVPREGFKPFVPMGSLSVANMIIGPIEKREGNSGTKFQNGDTLVARITPCLENGKTGFVNFLNEEQPVAFGSTEFIVLRPLVIGQHAIYCLARSHAFRDVAIKSMSGSEGRQRVRPESVKSFPLAKPPAALLERFEQIAQPMFTQISTLARTNANLRAQRDVLLPKLISGEIDVSEAEEAVEAAE